MGCVYQIRITVSLSGTLATETNLTGLHEVFVINSSNLERTVKLLYNKVMLNISI